MVAYLRRHFQRHCGLDDRHHRGLANHARHHATKRQAAHVDDGSGRRFWNGNLSAARSTIHSVETDGLQLGVSRAFFGSQFVGEKTLLERLLGQQLVLGTAIWRRLNALWVTNFIAVGALNIYVAYQYEEAFWVSYKLYSSIGFTVLLMLLTIIIVAPHLKSVEQDTDPTRDSS